MWDGPLNNKFHLRCQDYNFIFFQRCKEVPVQIVNCCNQRPIYPILPVSADRHPVALSVQAAVLCQFLDEVDYASAFQYASERNCADAMDAYYECIWDVTLLEYLTSLHPPAGRAPQTAAGYPSHRPTGAQFQQQWGDSARGGVCEKGQVPPRDGEAVCGVTRMEREGEGCPKRRVGGVWCEPAQRLSMSVDKGRDTRTWRRYRRIAWMGVACERYWVRGVRWSAVRRVAPGGGDSELRWTPMVTSVRRAVRLLKTIFWKVGGPMAYVVQNYFPSSTMPF